MLPIIAIVGRPNVGKSTLFNSICGRRLSIVESSEGVTRDRLYERSSCLGKEFILVDTGGMISSEDPLTQQIFKQSQIALEEADAVILVVDVRAGILHLDEELLGILRRYRKPVFIAANKVDTPNLHLLVHEFEAFGYPVYPIAASHGSGVFDLLEAVLDPFDIQDEQKEEPFLRIAIVGRPNVGKSTLMNCVLGSERSVMGEEAGTTRDSVDSTFSWNSYKFVLTDTSGIKKRKARQGDLLDQLAFLRTERALERSDIAIP
uniref:ribosome biogenesis GTPase Der n=1 Tax=Candidatus Similichlamydia epinepheli TaxID=1903953 RepID=UPI000D347AE3